MLSTLTISFSVFLLFKIHFFMFIQISTQICTQVSDEIKSRYPSQSSQVPFDIYLYYAIQAWCNQLGIKKDITDYILQESQLNEVKELTKYISQEGLVEKKTWKIPTPLGNAPTPFTVENQFYKYLNAFFYRRINIKSEQMKLLVLIAFVITAVSYCIYILNQPRQQQTTRREEPIQYNPKPPSPTVQAPLQRIIKQVLVLVVSALQADFLESLGAKRHINYNDGESLYDITKYLWLGSETELSQRTANINQYSVSKGQESEYDIYLVYIELNQAYEGFKSNINQLDRYDAFRKLTDLSVNLKVSPRLQMEAYGNIEVYNR